MKRIRERILQNLKKFGAKKRTFFPGKEFLPPYLIHHRPKKKLLPDVIVSIASAEIKGNKAYDEEFQSRHHFTGRC